jgi:serine/threonine-protein kinase
VPKHQARERFALDDLMRPRIYTANDFKPLGPGLVEDRTTGLVWQQSGTRFPVNWKGAAEHLLFLNQTRECGRTGWRLPTIPELMTLVRQAPSGRDHCLEPVFDQAQGSLWSADRCTFLTAWYLSLDMGFVAFNDFSSWYHVKAVTGG